MRAYLYTTARNLIYQDLQIKLPTSPLDPEGTGLPTLPGSDHRFSRDAEFTPLREAFDSLRPAWQEVLWYGEVERAKPRELALVLGLSPNACSQLLIRARRGLAEAFAHAQARAELPAECHPFIPQILALRAGKRPRSLSAPFRRHREMCEHCRVISRRTPADGTTLALLLGPLILGPAVVGGGVLVGGVSETARAVALPLAAQSTGVLAAAAVVATAVTISIITILSSPEATAPPVSTLASTPLATPTHTDATTPAPNEQAPAPAPSEQTGHAGVHIEAAAPATAAGTFPLTITTANTGGNAGEVSFSITLTGPGTLVGLTQGAGIGWYCATSESESTCALPEIPAGARGEFTLFVTPTGVSGEIITAGLSLLTGEATHTEALSIRLD
ncbi:sigma-70 family RNA polymerase sigma factor [Mycetocola lacteus]|uniref:Sigma-70 family RNA polymerase sigma factor n=1 Tax=Mycetocola lacteus TaxID=76637 RepID=A0A3L7AHJ8_9MICO|nr:sigma-70 family RNA polymerase sigma factor [Mycetocola lacteus]